MDCWAKVWGLILPGTLNLLLARGSQESPFPGGLEELNGLQKTYRKLIGEV